MQLAWVLCEDGDWCSFERLDLTHMAVKDVDGVYVIWHDGSHSEYALHCVRVGQGNISDRIGDHRRDIEITTYDSRGKLFVTWAAISDLETRLGVERFLADQLDPLVGTYPDVQPILVNFPTL